jgi:hypothetical protein
MSKGWESKSVEEQQAEAQTKQSAHVESKGAAAEVQLQDADRNRKVQALQLQRERVLSERTSSPHRRTALTNALADIEEKLAELGWTIHL